jgi:hypothetical protein
MHQYHLDRVLGRGPWKVPLLIVCTLLLASGCARFQEAPDPAPPAPEPVAVPEELPEAPAEPLPQVATPEPEPEPEPPPAEPSPDRIAIVLSGRSPAYERVAVELGRLLDHYLLYNLADKSLSPREVFAGIADSDAEVVIAIGLKAAEQAMAFSTLPVVFCQVFNIDVTESVAPIRGVASIPPLSPQVRAWKQLHPGLETVGAILGAGHEGLLAEAQVAAAENDVEIYYHIATTDRETLYLFNRMAPDLDGFWLFPDNRVLSLAILKEMLSYADRHHVQVAVFNPALLEMGAALSVTSVDADIAATAIEVANRIINGELEAIPAMTPLRQVDVRLASRLAGGTAAKGAQ